VSGGFYGFWRRSAGSAHCDRRSGHPHRVPCRSLSILRRVRGRSPTSSPRNANVIQLAVAKHLRVRRSQRFMVGRAVGVEADPEDGRLLGVKPRLLLVSSSVIVYVPSWPGGCYAGRVLCASPSQVKEAKQSRQHLPNVFGSRLFFLLPSPVRFGPSDRVRARRFHFPRRRAKSAGILRMTALELSSSQSIIQMDEAGASWPGGALKASLPL